MSTVARRLRRALGIEPGEEQLFFWSATALFLAGFATVAIANVSETFFLKRVGVSLLPFVFLVNSLLLAATTFAVGRLATRTDHRRLLTWTFALLGLAVLPLWVLVVADVTSAFALLVIAAKQLDAVAMLVFWTALGGLVTGRQGKRLFAPITAGGTLGTIAGSFASGPIGKTLGIAALLPICGLLLAAGALATIPLHRLRQGRLPATARRRAPVEDDPVRRLLPLWQEGGLVRVLVGSALFAGILGPVLYFQFSYVADLATQGAGGEQKLLALYGQFRGWINVGVLLLQLVGTAAIFRRVGVPLASALSPLIYFLGLLGLSVRLSLPAGIGAMAGVSLQDHAVYDPAQRILVTLFPERVRAAVTTAIDGPVKRAGAVVGNLVILAALAVGSPHWVGYAGLPIAAAWLALSLKLWRVYPTVLIEVASAGRTEADGVPLADLVDSGTLRVLEQSLTSADPERCRAACALVLEAPRARAVPALARALRTAPAANRPIIIATLDRLVHDASAPAVVDREAARDVAMLLTAPGTTLEPRERADLVQAFTRLHGPILAGSEAHGLVAEVSADGEEAPRLAALAALHRAGLAEDGWSDLETTLTAGLASRDAATRHVAREELRTELLRTDDGVRWDARLALLASHLRSPEDRPHAAAAIADLASRYGRRLARHAPALLVHRNDPDVRVRTAVVRFVGHAGLVRQARLVVPHLSADDPGEAAAAREALSILGPAVVDVLLDTLRFGRRRARDAVLPILHGIPIDPDTLRRLVERELENARTLVVLADVLGAGKISDLVLQRLRERVDESIRTVLLLLATLLDEERLTRLCRLLGRTRGVRERAVLLEALEALLPVEERERILPLLEEQSPQALAKAAARALRRALPSFDEALGEALRSEDALTHGLLASTVDPAILARHEPGFDARLAASHLLRGRAARRDPAAPVDPDEASMPYRETDTESVLSSVETILHLRSLDLFERLTTGQLTELAGVVEEVGVTGGATIVTEGEFDDCMYFIVDGRVRIDKGGATLAELGAREFFGEMAVFDGETRSATVVALGPVRLLRLARHDLFQVMEEQPGIAITICQTLTRRVRDLLNDRREPGGDAGRESKRSTSGPDAA